MSMAIAEEVANYQSLRPMQKTKNVLVALIVIIAGIAIFSAAILLGITQSSDGMPMDILIADIFLFIGPILFLSIFIYLNHIWAIIMFLLLGIIDVTQSIITQNFGIIYMIISAILIWLSCRSFIVARDLKRPAAK